MMVARAFLLAETDPRGLQCNLFITFITGMINLNGVARARCIQSAISRWSHRTIFRDLMAAAQLKKASCTPLLPS